MAKKKLMLVDVAEVLGVHPRTVLRYASGDGNAYWAPGYNLEVDIIQIAKGFKSEPEHFIKVVGRTMRGKDSILPPTEMAGMIGVPLRTFRYRKYPALIHTGQIVRFSQYDTINHHLENFKK
jgi:hypothetical protein